MLLAGVQRWVSLALGLALLVGLAASRGATQWIPVTRLVNPLKSRMAVLLRQRSLLAIFGVGTVPMMLAISLSGKVVPATLRLKLRGLVPVSLFLVAALLILRGMALGIPYLSPDLASGHGACCHK